MVIAINVHTDGNILGILPLICTLMTIKIVIKMYINDNITKIDLRGVKGLMIVHNVLQYIKSCYTKSYHLNMNKCAEINKYIFCKSFLV